MPTDPNELVRVTDKLTGHHYTIKRLVLTANSGRYRELKSPPADRMGRPLPPTFAPVEQASEADVTTAATITNTTKE